VLPQFGVFGAFGLWRVMPAMVAASW
jgi:hypothetical protein